MGNVVLMLLARYSQEFFRGRRGFFGHCAVCSNFIAGRPCLVVPGVNGRGDLETFCCCSKRCAQAMIESLGRENVADVLGKFMAQQMAATKERFHEEPRIG